MRKYNEHVLNCAVAFLIVQLFSEYRVCSFLSSSLSVSLVAIHAGVLHHCFSWIHPLSIDRMFTSVRHSVYFSNSCKTPRAPVLTRRVIFRHLMTAIRVISSQGPFRRLSMKFLECVDVTPSAGVYQIRFYLQHIYTWHKHVLPPCCILSPSFTSHGRLISAAPLSDGVLLDLRPKRRACLLLLHLPQSVSLQRVKRRHPIRLHGVFAAILHLLHLLYGHCQLDTLCLFSTDSFLIDLQLDTAQLGPHFLLYDRAVSCPIEKQKVAVASRCVEL